MYAGCNLLQDIREVYRGSRIGIDNREFAFQDNL